MRHAGGGDASAPIHKPKNNMGDLRVMKFSNRILSAAAAVAFVAATGFGMAPAAQAGDDVKVGIIFGFTGPIESLTPGMAASAELAMKEVTDSGKFLGGKAMIPIRADSTCVDSA